MHFDDFKDIISIIDIILLLGLLYNHLTKYVTMIYKGANL